MRGFCKALAAFLADEAGATSTEYALIAMGIAAAIVASLGAITNALNQSFEGLASGYD